MYLHNQPCTIYPQLPSRNPKPNFKLANAQPAQSYTPLNPEPCTLNLTPHYLHSQPQIPHPQPQLPHPRLESRYPTEAGSATGAMNRAQCVQEIQVRCPANMPHIRQSRPDSDFDFKAKVLESFGFVPFFASRKRWHCACLCVFTFSVLIGF